MFSDFKPSWVFGNILSRKIIASFLLFYVHGIFLGRIGAENWPTVLIFIQIITASFVLATNFLSRKHLFLTFKILQALGVTALANYLYFQSISSIYFLLISILSIDLIGEIVSTNAVSRVTTPISYKLMSPRIVQFSVFGGFLGAILLVLNNYIQSTTFIALISLVAFASNIFFYHKLSSYVLKNTNPKGTTHILVGIQRVQDLVKYILKNNLIKSILYLFILSVSITFIGEWLYFKSIETLIEDPAQIASILSIINIIIMVTILILQKSFIPFLTKKYSLSTLLLLTPFALIILSGIGITLSTSYIGILTQFILIIALKSIHTPTLKICLQIVNTKFKAKVFLLLNFMISIILFIMSSVLSSLKTSIGPAEIYALIILFCLITIMLAIKLDSEYFQRLHKVIKKQGDIDLNTMLDEKAEVDLVHDLQKYSIRSDVNIRDEIYNFLEEITIFEDKYQEVFLNDLLQKELSQVELEALSINIILNSKNKNLHIIIETFLKNSGHKCSFLDRYKKIVQYKGHYSLNDYKIRVFKEYNRSILSAQEIEKLELIINSNSKYKADIGVILSSKKLNDLKLQIIDFFNIEQGLKSIAKFSKEDLQLPFEVAVNKRRVLNILLGHTSIRPHIKLILDQRLEDIERKPISKLEVLNLVYLALWIEIDTKDLYIIESLEMHKSYQGYTRDLWKDYYFEYLKKLKYPRIAQAFNDLI